MLVLSHQQLLLGFNPLDLAEVPSIIEKNSNPLASDYRHIENCLAIHQMEATYQAGIWEYSARRLIGSLWAKSKVITLTE